MQSGEIWQWFPFLISLASRWLDHISNWLDLNALINDASSISWEWYWINSGPIINLVRLESKIRSSRRCLSPSSSIVSRAQSRPNIGMSQKTDNYPVGSKQPIKDLWDIGFHSNCPLRVVKQIRGPRDNGLRVLGRGNSFSINVQTNFWSISPPPSAPCVRPIVSSVTLIYWIECSMSRKHALGMGFVHSGEH